MTRNRKLVATQQQSYIARATIFGAEDDVTLQQPYIGELIPESWLKTGRLIVGKRGSKNLLDWDTVQQQVPTLVLVRLRHRV